MAEQIMSTVRLILVLGYSILYGAAAVMAQGTGEAYLLNAGDQLGISVWKEEALQRTVTVLPDGTISFPLTGQLAAAGRTATDLQQALTQSLSAFIPEPVVTVTIESVSGNLIYVVGAVNNPGVFQASRPLDIVQALSLAGGFSTFADNSEIIVLRRSGDASIAIPFDFSEVEDGRKLESNILLQAGDIVVVPD
jgi:polysaccharide export outer membrane protein